ncbi:MAG: Regulatory protein BlaR1 [Planctomycetota bacterium]|jgi:beta-lactamase regulating signal transducer with metallopeptidase domain
MPRLFIGLPFLDSTTSEVVTRIGWVCYHSIWQGVCVAAILAMSLRMLPRHSTVHVNARYLLSLIALLALPTLSVCTYLTVEVNATSRTIAARELPSLDLVSPIEPWLPAACVSWSVGALLAALRLLVSWFLTRSVLSRAKSADDTSWQDRVERGRQTLGIDRVVRFLVSDSIDSPVVMGWLKPVILWPSSALTGMAPQVMDAIIAHELAHVRRLDVLVNYLQACIEVLFYHHPAAWWISARIRAEREYCVDELSVRVLESNRSGSRLSYAQALLALEEWRASPAFSMASSGGCLLDRIRRLVGVQETPNSPARLLAAAVTAVCLSGLIVFGTFAPRSAKAKLWRSELVTTMDEMASSQAGTTTPTVDDGQPASAQRARIEPPGQAGQPSEVSSIVVTEPIADAILARLSHAGVTSEVVESIDGEARKAIKSGSPLELRQVLARLEALGVSWQRLQAPPRGMPAPEPIADTNLVTAPIADAIRVRLVNARINAEIVETIDMEARRAIETGSPLELSQIHSRLEELGIAWQRLHAPPDGPLDPRP